MLSLATFTIIVNLPLTTMGFLLIITLIMNRSTLTTIIDSIQVVIPATTSTITTQNLHIPSL